MPTEKSLENLKKRVPFKPNDPVTGEKDERINRTKGSRSDLFDRVLDDQATYEEVLEWYKDIRNQLKRGNMKAADILLDRAFGKVATTVNANIETHGKDELIVNITSNAKELRISEYGDEPAAPMASELDKSEEVGS